jgi:hypothetical protein
VKSRCGGRTHGGLRGVYVFGWRGVSSLVWTATLVGRGDGMRCNER